MKKTTLILICHLISFTILSQNLKGKIIYKITNDISLKTDTIKNVKVKNLISKLISNSKVDNISFELFFDKRESSFQYVENMEQDNSTINILLIDAQNRGHIYSNHNTKTTLTSMPQDEILIRDSFSQFKWQLTQETKNIGGFICYKATGEKQIYRKRGDFYKTINLVAWYAPQINIPSGPAGYGGLPGLILELKEGELIKLNLKNKKSVKSPPKNKVIERNEYNKFTRKLYLNNLGN